MKTSFRLSLVFVISSFFLFNNYANCNFPQYFEDDNIDDAISYNDKMINIQAKVDDSLVELIDTIDIGKDCNIKNALKACKKTIKNAKKEIKKIGKFNNDDEYQVELLKLISMYEDIVKNEMKEIIKFAASIETLSESEFETYYNLYDSALDKYDNAFYDFQTFQNKFAETWGFTIE